MLDLLTSQHVLCDVEVKTTDVKLHRSLLWPDHGIGVGHADPVLLGLARLDYDRHAHQLLSRQTHSLDIKKKVMHPS